MTELELSLPLYARNLMSIMIPYSTDYWIFTSSRRKNTVDTLADTVVGEDRLKEVGASSISYNECTEDHKNIMGIFLVRPLNAYGDDKEEILKHLLTYDGVHGEHDRHTPTSLLTYRRGCIKEAFSHAGVCSIGSDWFTMYPFTLFLGNANTVTAPFNPQRDTLFGSLSGNTTMRIAAAIRNTLSLLEVPSVVVVQLNCNKTSPTLSFSITTCHSKANAETVTRTLLSKYIDMTLDLLDGCKMVPDQYSSIDGMLGTRFYKYPFCDMVERGIMNFNGSTYSIPIFTSRLYPYITDVNEAMKGNDPNEREGRPAPDSAEFSKWSKRDESLVFLLRKAEERGSFAWLSW